MRIVLVSIALLISVPGISQEESPEATKKALAASNNFTYDANTELADNNFNEAEASYRKAISKSDENTTAKYNMGNAYYRENSMGEAFLRYKQASEVALTKSEKHKTYHNMGNVFMNNKEYEKAVEAYKEALRNNPSDEETRYNLALAKEMLKKQQQEQKNDQNKDQQNQDQDKKDNEDKKDDKGEKEEKKEDQGDNKEGEDEKKEDKKDGKGDKEEEEKKEQQKKGDPSEEKKDKQKPRPNQLSPQQMKNILEAMNNEEKKVQEKINAKKVKGVPVKAEKDW